MKIKDKLIIISVSSICIILVFILLYFLVTEQRLENNQKVVLIGIDGLEWDVIYPLIEKGELLNIKRLMDDGIYGNLTSIIPSKSPVVWTTIATGRTPADHGITDYLINNETASSKHRKVDAIWNILNRDGYSTGIVGYYSTWPVEKVAGYMISDRFRIMIEKKQEDKKDFESYSIANNKGLAYPFSLMNKYIQNIAKKGFLSENNNIEIKDDDSYDKALTDIYFSAYRADRINMDIAKYLLINEPQPDLFMVYLPGIDWISHYFWRFYQPEINYTHFPTPVTKQEKERFGEIILDYYKVIDGIIGHLQTLVEEDTTIIVISDHGFQALPWLLNNNSYYISGLHKHQGVFIAHGPTIRTVGEINDISVYDITPLILYIKGLPPGKKMIREFPEEIIKGAYRMK